MRCIKCGSDIGISKIRSRTYVCKFCNILFYAKIIKQFENGG